MSRQQPINFLPATYRQRLRQRQRNRRQGALAMVLLAALVAWWFVQQHQTAQMQQQAKNLEVEVENARQRMSEMIELRERYQTLRHQVRVQRLLSEPLRRTQIMATLGDRMPEPVTLTRMVLDTERPPAAALVAPSDDDARGSRGSHPHKVHMELSALAPDDMTVANLLTALKEHALFGEVSMHHSRSAERYDVVARQFRLSTVIDLDRQFEPTTPADDPSQRVSPPTETGQASEAVDGDRLSGTSGDNKGNDGNDRNDRKEEMARVNP